MLKTNRKRKQNKQRKRQSCATNISAAISVYTVETVADTVAPITSVSPTTALETNTMKANFHRAVGSPRICTIVDDYEFSSVVCKSGAGGMVRRSVDSKVVLGPTPSVAKCDKQEVFTNSSGKEAPDQGYESSEEDQDD